MKRTVAVLMIALLLTAATAAAAEGITGGWSAAESQELTEERLAVFEKGLEGLLGVKYVPVAYLGSQVVAGMNHCFLCTATTVYPGAQPQYALVYMYQDLSGGVHLMNIVTFDFGAYCEYGLADTTD